MARGYALWLMPSGKTHEKLSCMIMELSKRHHTPYFEPHVTLSTEDYKDSRNELLEKTRALANQIRPFTVQLAGLGHEDSYWRPLYIKARMTPQIMRANEKAAEIFQGGRQPGPYKPHLSLLYGRLPTEARENIIAKIGTSLNGLSFKAQSIHLYSLNGAADKWHSVKEFSFSGNVSQDF